MQVKSRVALTPANFEKLSTINKKYKIPVTTLANSCISEKLIDKIELLKEFNSVDSDNETEVKFKITDSEKSYLLNSSKLTGSNSLTQEIRLRLLNSIYEKRFLTPKELEAFFSLKYELNKIGVNVHQILKRINFKEELNIDDLKANIKELSIKLDETKRARKYFKIYK